MSSNKIFRSAIKATMLLLVASISTFMFTSCEEEDEPFGEPYFKIEDDPTGINAGVEGTTKRYTVRSNRPWRVVAQEESDWVRAFPNVGEDDGIFRFIVSENPTFEARTATFAFVVDGEEQPVLFSVEQTANIPFITIDGAGEGITIASGEEEVVINLSTNVNWSYHLDDGNWLNEMEVSEAGIRLLAAKNTGVERTSILTVSATDVSGLKQEIVITQLPGNILLTEDFSWLTYGNAIPYVTSGETRYDKWTNEEKNRGWYSTPVAVSSNQQIVYARPGFVKLGKTRFGGDLISPKMDIEGTVNLKVTFKAAVYISAKGTIDDNILKVSALGDGVASVSQLNIDNVPNSEAEDMANIENDIWADDRAYSFTITGATSETQVRFLGGDFELTGVGKGKNRIFLDDIQIEIIE